MVKRKSMEITGNWGRNREIMATCKELGIPWNSK
jgi:hypothetical protein